MNKPELAAEMQRIAGFGTRKDALRYMRAMVIAIGNGMRESGAVSIKDFGLFYRAVRKAQKGSRIKTCNGDPIYIPETVSVRFKAGQWLRRAVGGKTRATRSACKKRHP